MKIFESIVIFVVPALVNCSDSSFNGANKFKNSTPERLSSDLTLPPDGTPPVTGSGQGTVIEVMDCKLDVARIGGSDRCTITVAGIGSTEPRLKANNLSVEGIRWKNKTAGNFSTEAICPTDADTVFSVELPELTSKCAKGIFKWFRKIGNGDPGFFGRTAIPTRPLANAQTSTVRCEGSTWQQIANENGFSKFSYDANTWWKWQNMCRHNDGRYNYTSCGDNRHFDWNGSAWITIPACNDSWTTHLQVYDPVPATFDVP